MKSAEDLEEQVQKFGARTAERVGLAADKAGAKVDAAVDYVSGQTQQISETLQRIGNEGWDGIRRRTTDYAHNAPFTTLLATLGVGILVGWLLRREH
jgi:ElaB/YqjD/DUF883 family membrane-anchored ribosome-binding protein